MLDITQLNHSLSSGDATGKGGLHPGSVLIRAVAPASNRHRSRPDGGVTFKFGHDPHLPVLRRTDSVRHLALENVKPTVTWRVTRCGNLDCLNCPSDAQSCRHEPELSTEEGKALIRDLAEFGVPRLIFAGGEPLLRADLFDLVAYAREQGIQPSLLTNGTLLTSANAARLHHAGLHSASIWLEGIGREVDRQRGARRACQAVPDGYASCEAAGIPAEIRMPLTRENYRQLAEILDAMERWRIRKVVFAHMVYAGRGNQPADDLTHEEKRRALDMILDRAEDFSRCDIKIDIATDDNHTDGIYYYLRLANKNPRRAATAFRLLRASGAEVQGAGTGAAGIDSVGNVQPDPYWSDHLLGNVRHIPFSEIWRKSADPLLQGLRNRLPLLTGRCANCRWKATCGGNLRVRAAQFYGDPWTSDPACYLTNQEISKEVIEPVETMADDVLLSEQAA
jgi:Fe-coproporphyrin III synthase